MSVASPKTWSRAELLDLLAEEDVAELWNVWGLPKSGVMARDSLEFIAKAEELSRSSLLRDILALQTPTLQMLRDVASFLQQSGASVRTTGCHIALRDDFDISPQQIDAVLDWSGSRASRRLDAGWPGLTERLAQDIAPFFRQVARSGEVQLATKQENISQTIMRQQTRGVWSPRSFQEANYNQERIAERQEFVKDLTELIRKLDGVKGQGQAFLDEIEKFGLLHQRALNADLNRIDQADRECSWADLPEIAEEGIETWKRFQEDVMSMAKLEEGKGVADLLRIDLFRKRPQLYELWIVVTVLNFLRRTGFRAELLSVEQSDAGRATWMLNYAKSGKPVARLFRASDNCTLHLFYQLFRQGTARNHMPDIALLPSADPCATPLWIMDPKHSERAGYSLADYRKVGMRYQNTFSPGRTWIIEYFPRAEISGSDPVSFSPEVELLRDVAPSAKGAALLRERLEEFHGPARPEVMAVIDLSKSHADRLPTVIADLQRLMEGGTMISDKIVWFADAAAVTEDNIDQLPQGLLNLPKSIGGGTRIRPVIEKIQAMGSQAIRLRVYTDAQFSDLSREQAIEYLGLLGTVEFGPLS